MRKSLAALALLGLLVAGCMGSTETTTSPPPTFQPDVRHGPGFNYTATDKHGLPVPFPLCHEGQRSNWSDGCNINLTPTPTRQGNEVTIAVDPTNPRNIVGGAKDYFPADAGE